MSTKRQIEIFTADCPLCAETVKLVKKEASEKCDVVVRKCSGEECCCEAKAYDIKSVPTIVVDGKITIVGKPSESEVKQLFI